MLRFQEIRGASLDTKFSRDMLAFSWEGWVWGIYYSKLKGNECPLCPSWMHAPQPENH